MVDYVAVLVASVVVFLLGWAWYSVLFGKQWRQLMGFTDEAMRSMRMTGPQAMLGGFLSTLVLVYVFASILSAGTSGDAVAFALTIGVGVIAMTMLNSVWYENRPWRLYFINAGYYVVALVIAALILFYW